MNEEKQQFLDYWGRILAAIFLIKAATKLVRDAERLITASVKARHTEVAEVMNGTTPTPEVTTDTDEPELASDNGNGLHVADTENVDNG